MRELANAVADSAHWLSWSPQQQPSAPSSGAVRVPPERQSPKWYAMAKPIVTSSATFARSAARKCAAVVTVGLVGAGKRGSLRLVPSNVTITSLPPISTVGCNEAHIDGHLEELRAPFLAALPPSQQPA